MKMYEMGASWSDLLSKKKKRLAEGHGGADETVRTLLSFPGGTHVFSLLDVFMLCLFLDSQIHQIHQIHQIPKQSDSERLTTRSKSEMKAKGKPRCFNDVLPWSLEKHFLIQPSEDLKKRSANISNKNQQNSA
jgi:hypothetical protein